MTTSNSAAPTSTGTESDWFKDAVIYELHLRAFSDSDGDGVGDLVGLRNRLDYLADLGITAIWMLPFYPSPQRDNGYDIADYKTVNPEYGTTKDFQKLLDAAHERGIRVITELVINHTSDQHPWFERARRAPKGSPERDFYVWTDNPEDYSDARIIFQDFETSNWTWDPVAGQYFWHRFYSHQPDLNFDNPAVEEAVLGVLDFWLDMGVDGLRLDAVPYLYEREGTTCENLPETHAALKRMRAHMDAKYDDRMLLAEANQWPEDSAAYFGDGDECHMNFHFPVMPRLFMSVQMENRTPIIDIMEQTPEPPPGCQWATFLRNHDELTLEMVTEEERDLMLRAYARDDEMRINLGIRRRLAPLLGNDRRKIELLNALLFSLPGTPVVYYGDEIGMGDNVYLGDRDGVRTPMQWTSDRNAGFSDSNPHRLYLPLITEQEYHYESVNVETQSENPASLLSWMRQLIALRNRHPVLGRGAIEFLDPDNPHVLAFVRSMPGESGDVSMMCVANLSRLAQHVELDLDDHVGATPVEVFGQNRFAQIGALPYHLTLAPYGFFWFSLEHARDETGRQSIPHLPGTLDEVGRRKAALTRALGTWLPERRWYAGKDRKIRDLTVEAVVPMDDDLIFATAVVSFTEGDDQRYAVPMLRITGESATAIENQHASTVIARLDDGALLIDAMTDARGAARLVAAAVGGERVEQGRNRLTGRPERHDLDGVADDWRNVTIMGVEQSNSSVIVSHPGGERLIAKLIRRVEVGDNPDIELPRHLSRTGFEHAPGVAATLELALAKEISSAAVMVVHDAVDHESDLWVRVLDDLSLAIDNDVLFRDHGTGANAPAVDKVSGSLADLLGRRTAELHRALAEGSSEEMEPAAFNLQWQRSILQTVRNSVRATQRELKRRRRADDLDAEAAKLADLVIDRGDELISRFDPLMATKMMAKRIRIHGDLHLGQILWTGHDIVFIDFEGEPGRPMGQRTIKRSPLGDVAGLLRSLDYAGRVAVDTAVERGRVSDAGRATVEAWRSAWTQEMQRRLLDAYAEAVAGTGLVPDDADEMRLLLEVYMVTKSLYEVRYELANRPAWVSWPLHAVAEMLHDAPLEGFLAPVEGCPMISDALRRRAIELGVEVTYEDVDQVIHDADEMVVERVVQILDDDRGRHPSGVVEPIHLDPSRPVSVSARPTDAELLVDGASVDVTLGATSLDLPAGLPVGCHQLRVDADGHISEAIVVVTPAAMPGFDPAERSTCLFVPTYALWERDDPLPSFGHLGRLAERSTGLGVDMIATLPLYAAFLDEPFDPSPYSPISRLHWNEVYLSDEGLPDSPIPASGAHVDWRALGERRRTQLLRAALDADESLVGELDRFRAAFPDVGSFARFMASRESGGDLIVERSHVLAQYLADRQLQDVGREGSASLSLDLPIGSHPEGWETWAHPQLFAPSMSVGAPPDTFFTDGQNWGFSPQLPATMRQSGYELWRQMIARAARYCDLLRIDHVMAVHRLWWIPDGQPADRGVYVRYPHDELLAVIAAEAARAGVGIVGENLGTVPPEVDRALDEWNVLGMHEEQFHLDDSALVDIPARSIAGVRTHDMAPFARVAGDPTAADDLSSYRRRLGPNATPDVPLLDAVLERLAASDAQVVVADLDDLVDETRPHNLPGRVVDGIWRRRLDHPTSETLTDERVVRRLGLLERTPR